MTEIALRDLCDNTGDVLRRVEAGEELTVTVNGGGVAQLVPLPRRKQYLSGAEWLVMREKRYLADPGLLDDLRQMLPDTTADIEDLWEKAARR